MQEIFIKQLGKVVENFSIKFNEGKRWPVQFVLSTHSPHIANSTQFESIRYFLCDRTETAKTQIKDVNSNFVCNEKSSDYLFIKKFLTLTKCDLFFADKAIFVEGTSERILMPAIIQKSDKSKDLESQYISIIEIGGAFAHHFYKLLDFLELKTLIITDLDSIDAERKACVVSKALDTSNSGILKWFGKDSYKPYELIQLDPAEKVEKNRRIAFQIPENLGTPTGRSFEEAFIIANLTLFKIDEHSEDSEEQIKKNADKVKTKKTDFAIHHLIEEPNWKVPLYIKEGLDWLAENVIPEKQINYCDEGSTENE